MLCFQSKSDCLRTRRANGVNSRAQVQRQERLMSQPNDSQAERTNSSRPCCSIQDFNGLNEAHPKWGGQSSWLRPPVQMLNLSRDPHRITFTHVTEHPVGPVKLTQKINPHGSWAACVDHCFQKLRNPIKFLLCGQNTSPGTSQDWAWTPQYHLRAVWLKTNDLTSLNLFPHL